MSIKLSVCIPTYNRARYIGDVLESIISQANDNIEIVIVDGASTDNTTEVVKKYQQTFRNIVYCRTRENGGVDKDMAKTIELARGEYCWLMSDDDMLKPGAINRMLREIESGYEIYLCNITFCSLRMQPIRDRFWLSSNVQDKVFNLHNKYELIKYCNQANSIGALFSYMSSLIINRRAWLEAGFHHDFDGTAYAMASSLLSFITKKCRLKYIRTSLILWRNDNESFQNAGGPVKRFLLDFNGYLRLADKYLSDDHNMRNSFLKVMTREHPWYTIINVTSFIDSSEVWKPFRNKMLQFGYDPMMIAACYALGRFKTIISIAVAIKRKILRIRWIFKVK